MAAPTEAAEIKAPSLPAKHDEFIEYIANHPETPLLNLLEPYKQYDTEVRKAFAQQPDHPLAKQPNVVPVFTGHEQHVKIRARNFEAESDKEKECYIMPLKNESRKLDGSPAIVQSLKEFQTNFNVFSESSLVDLDWSNVIVAGSAVVTSLLAVPEKHAESKRALRQYYHDKIAPASDVDLFLYGLTEEEGIEKIKQIERNVRDALLLETTTVRTKNAITIVSRHPVRHVQIVLRIYKSISEILTGFDVDCSCAAFDGTQVYASPRALISFMTQINTIDLTRRSPSYEMRLSKYARRGFEVYWPQLDRTKVDPTIFERSFSRTEGLSRLLILEKLPKNADREAYLDQRRRERGRPPANRWRMRKQKFRGNIKDDYEDEIAEWDEEDLSNYHTIAIPYGPKFNAKKIEKLLYKKDMLLNVEWNKPKDREVNLHRHPAFFGTAEDVIHDCCGYCPEPTTIEEEEVAEEERKFFVFGEIGFMKDDPGRQAIGSFNPLTADDWTAMAYVGDTARLCQAIVDGDLEYVESWLAEDGNDPNIRDYTGRAPLHLAVASSTPEIVQALIDHGARLVARLVDGKTALHLACIRGNVEMVSALLRKSEANDEEEQKKIDARRAVRKAAKEGNSGDVTMHDTGTETTAASGSGEPSDIDMMEDADMDSNVDATTESSLVNIKSLNISGTDRDTADIELTDDKKAEEEPDVYDVNVVAWDTAVSPLHLAIVQGHVDVVKTLVQDFGADVLLPVKFFDEFDKSPTAAILTLVLALKLPLEKAEEMVRTLIQLGSTTAQASVNQTTAMQSCVAHRPDLLDTLAEEDATGFNRALNHLSIEKFVFAHMIRVSSPLMTAIEARDSLTAVRLLSAGAKPEIDFSAYMRAWQARHEAPKDSKRNKESFQHYQDQPIVSAVECELPLLAKTLIENYAVDINTLTTEGYRVVNDKHFAAHRKGQSLLDLVQEKLKDLREWNWESEVETPEPPTPLEDDNEYLSTFKEDTYLLWSAKRQLNTAKKDYENRLKSYNKKLEQAKNKTGETEKRKAINEKVDEFQQLETALKKLGAKNFEELFPKAHERYERRDSYRFNPGDPKPFEIEFEFRLGNLTDQDQERYKSLFEAAWSGDFMTLKKLTLIPWKDDDGDQQTPCAVAVQDQHSMSPFSAAVLRGHLELAKMILEIAKAQHKARDAPKQRRYMLSGGGNESENSEEDENSSDEDVNTFSEVVDDEFTVDTIGEISVEVKSSVDPHRLLGWSCPAKDFMKSAERRESMMKRTNTGSIKVPDHAKPSSSASKELCEPTNLFQLAIHNDEPGVLTFLLDLDEAYSNSTGKTSNTWINEFVYAVNVGRPHFVAELIKRFGAGIPLDELAKKYGVEVQETTNTYQGLSVRGVKRKDWAEAGRSWNGRTLIQDSRTPLLTACENASLDLVEWFLSDTPLRHYKEFAESHQSDKRVQSLAQSKIGFETCVEKYLGLHSNLAISMCVKAEETVESLKTLQYLIRAMPETIDAKNVDGFTPLLVAFRLYNKDAAKALIEAGANEACKDKSGRNLVHSLLSRTFHSHDVVEEFRGMLNLIDRRLLPSMLLERATGSLTPLHFFLTKNAHSDEYDLAVTKTLLDHSDGQELALINGEGNTPLHSAIQDENREIATLLVERDPTLLNRENATGRTPFEMAEDIILGRMFEVPSMPPEHTFFHEKAERFGWHPHYAEPVLKREPASFAETAEQEHNSAVAIWDTLRQARDKLVAEGRNQRQLVSLNEANEVARRLAAMKSSGSGERRGDDENLSDALHDALILTGWSVPQVAGRRAGVGLFGESRWEAALS